MTSIFCFSSTGNSLYVAKRISNELEGKVISMTSDTHTCTDDIIGFVFPTFFFGLPQVVERFIKQLQIDNSQAYIFAVATCGNFTCNLASIIQKLLAKKGLKLSYYAKVKCVENYTPSYSVNDRPLIHERTDRKVDQIIKDLREKKKTHIRLFSLINRAIYLRYPANRSISCDKKFSVNQCSSCGTCVKICPFKNIKLENGKPKFQGNCQLCLACLHICPNEAINWNRGTKKRARYTNPHIKKSELIEFMNQ